MGAGLACILFSAQVLANPLSALSAQEQFLESLHTHQEQNRRSIYQSDQEILYLENRMAANEAEAARKQRELSDPNVPAPSPAEQLQQREGARAALEQARAERAQLDAELDRRHRERARLAREHKKLLQLESEYEADPQRAGELMGDLH
jgi:hypothetical protein